MIVSLEQDAVSVNHRNVDLEVSVDENRTSSELKLRSRRLNDDDMEIVAHRALHNNQVDRRQSTSDSLNDLTSCIDNYRSRSGLQSHWSKRNGKPYSRPKCKSGTRIDARSRHYS